MAEILSQEEIDALLEVIEEEEEKEMKEERKKEELKSLSLPERIKKCMEYIIENYCSFPSTPHFTSKIGNALLFRNVTFKIKDDLYIILSDKFLYHYTDLMLGGDGDVPDNFEIDETIVELGSELVKSACSHCECDFEDIEVVNLENKNDLLSFYLKTYEDENGYVFSILYKLNKEEKKEDIITDSDFKITGCKDGKITIEISIDKFSKILNQLLKD